MTIAKGAFEAHVVALLPRLLGVARHLSGNDADAEDLVAESVARAWRSLDTLQCDAAFKGWIFRILHNTFVSEYRRACARPRCQPIEAEDDDETPFSLFEQMHQPFLLWFSNPEQAFIDKLLREDLERALAALPENHRVVVVLADLEEFNYAEIAEMLGVPIGTVRSRLARAQRAAAAPVAPGAGLRAACHHRVSRTKGRKAVMTRHEIDCEEALRHLFDFLDHELDGDERDAMQRHLSTCRSCYSRANFERRLKDRLRDLRHDEPAVNTQERIKHLLQSF